jgi:hypothetical protein
MCSLRTSVDDITKTDRILGMAEKKATEEKCK